MEDLLQNQSATYIANFFNNAGYTASNNEGQSSTRSNIIANLANTYQKDYWAIVDFDHGVVNHYPLAPSETHYQFEDDRGTEIGTYNNWALDTYGAVYDADIYGYTWNNRVVFALINTCLSAEYNDQYGGIPGGVGQGSNVYPSHYAVGMPYAFTHRLVATKTPGFDINTYISDDGYANPDSGNQVYIGFPYGSAALAQNIPYNYGYLYNNWLMAFLDSATSVYYGVSVNQALDLASNQAWGTSFADSPLRQGFTSNWPEINVYGNWQDNYGYGSTMAVYGNGNIFLYNFKPQYVSPPTIGADTNVGIAGQSYDFLATSISQAGQNIQYTFNWGDSSPENQTAWTTSGTAAYLSHSWISPGTYTITVTAQDQAGTWSSSRYFTMHVNAPIYHWLYLGAVDPYGNGVNAGVTVDDNPLGAGQVSEGYHYILFDWSAWDPTFWSYVSFQYAEDSNGNIYGNGAYVPVYSDTMVTGVYG